MIKELIMIAEELHGLITGFEITGDVMYIPSSERPCSVIMVKEDGIDLRSECKGIHVSGLCPSKMKSTYSQLFA